MLNRKTTIAVFTAALFLLCGVLIPIDRATLLSAAVVTDEFFSEFYNTSERLLQNMVDVPAEFWDWLSINEPIRKWLLLDRVPGLYFLFV